MYGGFPEIKGVKYGSGDLSIFLSSMCLIWASHKHFYMTIKTKSQVIDLALTLTGRVVFSVTVGNGQIGSSLVTFNDDPAVIAKGVVTNLDLGPAAALKGKTLHVVTNVLDTNNATNGIVITNFFSACTPAATVDTDIVDNDGDVYSLTTDFNFK